MKKQAQSVQDTLDAKGVKAIVKELPASTRTAKEAAAAVNCEVAQIAKSIVFKATDSERAVLVVASGNNQIDAGKVGAFLGEALNKASADFVREKTGFAIGGVPPCGHKRPLKVFIDKDLFEFDELWAAAGTPNAVFKLTPDDLRTIAEGEVIDVK